MKLTIPQPPECKECGSGPINHRLTYVSIAIDEFLESLLAPGEIGRMVAKPLFAAERKLMPLILELLMKLGVADRVTAPDDDTQLLALMSWQEATKRGITVHEFRLFGLPRNVFLATYPNGLKFVYEGNPLPPRAANRVPWMDNKAVMKEKFRELGLPVAKGGASSSVAGACKIFRSITPPVIVKPFSGSGSRHTVLHITNENELERAFAIAKQVAPRVVVEEELVGPVYRATVVDGKFAAALRRDQPHVIGDGTRTVRELVDSANEHPARSGPYFHKMKLDDDALEELAWQERTPESVLAPGEWAYLHQKINWSVGGTTADVTDIVHPDNVALFERVAEVLSTPMVGLDFIIGDITKSWREQKRCGVLECNSMPFYDNHHLPFEGEPRDVASLIWDMVERA